MVIKERIRQVAENKGIKYKDLYDILEMSDAGFKGEHLSKPIKSDALVYLVTKYPDIDLHWLITGKEAKKEEKEKNMLNEPPENYGSSYKDKYIEILEENRELQRKVINLLEVNGSLKKDSEPISNQ